MKLNSRELTWVLRAVLHAGSGSGVDGCDHALRLLNERRPAYIGSNRSSAKDLVGMYSRRAVPGRPDAASVQRLVERFRELDDSPVLNVVWTGELTRLDVFLSISGEMIGCLVWDGGPR